MDLGLGFGVRGRVEGEGRVGVRGIAQPLLELFGLDGVQHISGGPSLSRADLVAWKRGWPYT